MSANLFSMGASKTRKFSSRTSMGPSSEYILATDESTNQNDTIKPQEPPIEDVSSTSVFGMAHHYCGNVVTSPYFQWGIFICIIFNSIWMAIATFDFVSENPELDHVFIVVDEIFLVLFTIELFLNLGYYGRDFFRDGWMIFDFIIISLSWALMEITVFRAFRILRSFRVVTKMKAMKDLVQALLTVMPRMVAIFLLLLLIYFVFGVMFTEMFKDAYAEGYTSEDYFSRLDRTAFTCLQFMLLDDWSKITKEVSQMYSWAWIPILTFIVISTFIVINLIIAVICDAVGAIHTEEMTKQVSEIHHLTEDAMHHTDETHKNDIKRLEAKMNDINRQLGALVQRNRQTREAEKEQTEQTE